MIEEILPAEAQAVESFGDRTDIQLFDVEEAVIARAVDRRRRQFTTVRHCARKALDSLGLPPAAIVPGERGAPQWPPGVTGSMTHCPGYRAAVLGHTSDLVTIGIDAEPNEPLPQGLLDSIAGPEEQRCLPGRRGGAHWDRLAFSAKESVYKAWFPLTGRWLGFEDAILFIDPDRGTFAADLLVPGPEINGERLGCFHGRWLSRNGLLLTSVALTTRTAE